jgi:hypothetical protein
VFGEQVTVETLGDLSDVLGDDRQRGRDNRTSSVRKQ